MDSEMISADRCRELADHFKTLSQQTGTSPERARLLKNISFTFVGASGQLDRLAALRSPPVVSST
jgi:hypothetical protein